MKTRITLLDEIKALSCVAPLKEDSEAVARGVVAFDVAATGTLGSGINVLAGVGKSTTGSTFLVRLIQLMMESFVFKSLPKVFCIGVGARLDARVANGYVLFAGAGVSWSDSASADKLRETRARGFLKTKGMPSLVARCTLPGSSGI